MTTVPCNTGGKTTVQQRAPYMQSTVNAAWIVVVGLVGWALYALSGLTAPGVATNVAAVVWAIVLVGGIAAPFARSASSR